jgi:phosphinothricin acetyltransferase
MTRAIRLATAADAAGIAAIYAPIVRDTVISFEFDPPDAEEMRRRVETTLRFYPWLVCDAAGVVEGYAYAGQHRVRAAYQWSADVSVYIHERCRGRGIGRALYTALLDMLRAQGLFNAYAGITLPNAASVGLHAALGFTAVGVYRGVGFKFGAWHDVGWWEMRLLPSAEETPAAPLGLPDLKTTPAIAAALGRGSELLEG